MTQTTDPLYAGLNDRTITDIPKTVEKQRYMTSVAPMAANPGRWVAQPRLPIPTGEHAVIECQGKIHVIAGYARHRVDGTFHQVFDSKTGQCRKQMFDRRDAHAVLDERGRQPCIADVFGTRADIHGGVQIDATKNDTGINRCRTQRHVYLFAGVQTDARRANDVL